jgi:hypothetical protein
MQGLWEHFSTSKSQNRTLKQENNISDSMFNALHQLCESINPNSNEFDNGFLMVSLILLTSRGLSAI